MITLHENFPMTKFFVSVFFIFTVASTVAGKNRFESIFLFKLKGSPVQNIAPPSFMYAYCIYAE